jgi:hypothetical protein
MLVGGVARSFPRPPHYKTQIQNGISGVIHGSRVMIFDEKMSALYTRVGYRRLIGHAYLLK